MVIIMKTFLKKSYIAILFILFVSFIYIMKLDATSHMTLFAFSLILVSALLATLPFLINNYKKIRVRNWYIISMILTSVFVTYKALYILLIKFFINNTTLIQILNLYVPAILVALAITGSLFTLVYSFKDFFKKGQLDFIKCACLENKTNLLASKNIKSINRQKVLSIEEQLDNLNKRLQTIEKMLQDK